MLSGRVLFIAIFLCLVHVTKSYVLFTANVEDIKKVAGRFLSEAVVEQLVNLVKKISQMGKVDLSKENEYNVQTINQISEEMTERTGKAKKQKAEKKLGTQDIRRLKASFVGDEKNIQWESGNDNDKSYTDNEDLVIATSGPVKLPRLADLREKSKEELNMYI